MPAMENALSCTKPSNHQSSFRHRRSGYEPSDTETEWQDSPWHEGLSIPNRPRTPPGPERAISPLNHSQRNISKEESNYTSVKALGTSSATRRNSRSPYKPVRGAGDVAYSDLRRNISPLKVSEHHRHVSPYKARTKGSEHENNELKNSFQKRSQRTPPKIHNSSQKDTQSQLQEVSRVSERSKHSRNRAMSAPKLRAREKDQQFSSNSAVRGTDQISPLVKATIHNQQVGTCARSSSPKEINEVIASRKLSKSPSYDAHLTESTESVSFGDIFFSRDGTIPQKNSGMNNSNNRKKFAPSMKPVLERKAPLLYQESRGIKSSDQNPQAITVSTVLSRTNTSFGSAAGRLSSGRTNTSSNSAVGPLSRTSNDSSKFSDGSGKSGSFRKFTANIQRSQTEAWFSCVRRASCGKSKSPEYRAIDEATFIGKAIVVEELRMFWADKHSPHSLNGFICHKQQTQHLRQLDSTPEQIVVPLTSGPHHFELNLKSQSKNARYALMALVKEIVDNCADIPEVSDASFKMNYKVIVLHDVDKVTENIQHLIKWIMDCYTDACKIILCCEDDTNLLDSIKSRCKLIAMDAPVTHEIMEVLIEIAKKENFELSTSFAARIATRSKQNLRKAIMALEACKAHNFPFVDDQPIPLGWEDVLVELAAEILADPSPKRLFLIRGKFQKLLVEFVPPKLILQKLVEQFLKGIEAGLKRELYYWHAYYDKRLPAGTSALLKLEEFVAKFMSIHRKSF
ncbi:uncharacterized protein [Elaeis guineensis]|uniref:Uncharacterized protein LOC105058758 isoform X2 n=1 Tax=Elaeis guineensis var. tenera TaxID=51953 RepID=A0A6J0PRG6_ELAGV|nr:uncharacterized protein LOC105058758 isoform X2 [Elaeis guineensis]